MANSNAPPALPMAETSTVKVFLTAVRPVMYYGV